MTRLLARCLLGMSHVAALFGNRMRLLAVRAQYPDVQFHGRVILGKGTRITAARGATVIVRDCNIGRNCWIVAGPGATISIDADYIGPGSVLAARDSITIGPGSKLAEMVVVRDSNHDHSVPLRSMVFTSDPVTIGADVWLGARSTVLAGVTVGRGATLAAGAVVTSDVDEATTVAGVPAKPLGHTGADRGVPFAPSGSRTTGPELSRPD